MNGTSVSTYNDGDASPNGVDAIYKLSSGISFTGVTNTVYISNIRSLNMEVHGWCRLCKRYRFQTDIDL